MKHIREKSIANTRVDKDVLGFFVETTQVTQETGRFLFGVYGWIFQPPPKKKTTKPHLFEVLSFSQSFLSKKGLENTHPPPPSSSVGPTVVPQKSFMHHADAELLMVFVWGACRYISTGGLDGTLSSGYTFKTFGTLGHIRSLGERLGRDPGRCGERF